MPFPYEEFDLAGIRTYPLASRKSKVTTGDFASPLERGATVGSFLDALPNILTYSKNMVDLRNNDSAEFERLVLALLS